VSLLPKPLGARPDEPGEYLADVSENGPNNSVAPRLSSPSQALMHACKASAADDSEQSSCLFAPISSVRQFCCRSNGRRHYRRPAGRRAAATPKTPGVKDSRFFFANNAGSLAGVASPPCPFSSRGASTRSLARSLVFSCLSLARSIWPPRLENSRVFVAPLCQSGLLPLLPFIHCANSSTYSFIRPVLSHSCSLPLPLSCSFSLIRSSLRAFLSADRLRRYVAR